MIMMIVTVPASNRDNDIGGSHGLGRSLQQEEPETQKSHGLLPTSTGPGCEILSRTVRPGCGPIVLVSQAGRLQPAVERWI